MLIAFSFILVLGLGAFAFVFTKALKGSGTADPGALRPLQPAEPPEAAMVEPAPISFGILTDAPSQIAELKALREADELKIMKLEQMIEEKNTLITELQKASQSGHDHDAQVDSLKQILQAQIEELKQQNRQLKAENARLAQENTDLQTKVFATEMSKGPAAGRMEVSPAASTTPAAGAIRRVEEAPQEPPKDIDGSANSLSLHDVFGEEEKNS